MNWLLWLLQSFHFDRDDVALKGFHKFFKNQSHEEREHAEKLMAYQNMRGGRVLLQDVKVGLPLSQCIRHVNSSLDYDVLREFFQVKSVVLTHCWCAQPLCVYI